MDNKKRIIISVAIITFALLLVGGTFAWFYYGDAYIYGYSDAESTCFIIDYDYENDDGTMDMGGTLMQSSVPKTGLSGKVEMGIREDCSVTGEGTIYLNVTSADSPLLQSVKDHCENPNTLQTMKNYTTSSACTAEGYTWVTGKPALKYAVYEDVDSYPVSVGYISNTGDMTLYDEFPLYGSKVPYYIYIWLDGELADNSYMGVSFNGYIHLEAEQTEGLTGESYAVYSADDNSLRFYRSETPITAGSTYEGRTVTNVYTGFETGNYSDNYEAVPWHSNYSNIKKVVFEDVIRPINTGSWFFWFANCSYFDVEKLDTSKVTDMSHMFFDAGSSVSELSIEGIESWDVSSVTNMNTMFFNLGNQSTTFNMGDISSWNVSNVTNMGYMFQDSSNLINLDLSGWNVYKVTTYEGFDMNASSNLISPIWYTSYAVYSETDNSFRFYRTTTDLTQLTTYNGKTITAIYTDFETANYDSVNPAPWYGNASNITSVVVENEIYPTETEVWFEDFINCSYLNVEKIDVSNVTNMHEMFTNTGRDVSTFTIEGMDNWDTSKVTTMGSMFSGTGWYNATTYDIGDLSRWDTSNVTSMANMFNHAGIYASTFDIGNISFWDTSKVTSMRAMFNWTGNRATTFYIGNIRVWDTSNVTDMSYMFNYTGGSATDFSLNLSKWNVEKVTNYTNFNTGVESKIITPNFG